MKKKKGFTLVELLAVIVILAIILIIAVPQIINTIDESRNASFVSSAKLIATTAEREYLVKETLEDTDFKKLKILPCEEVIKINEIDYDACSIKFDDEGTAYVSLIGKGKFNNKNICDGTNSNIEIKTNDCRVDYGKGIEYIANLHAISASNNGLKKDGTAENSIRYVGSKNKVKNKVYFNCDDKYVENSKEIKYGSNDYDYNKHCEIWRIIGVFDVLNNTSGESDYRIKLVRDDALLSAAWDSSAESVNKGFGINQWGNSEYISKPEEKYEGSDIMNLLNGYYIETNDEDVLEVDKSACVYCDANNQPVCENDCSNMIKPLSKTFVDMIDNVVWYTGADSHSVKMSLSRIYSAERGSKTGKICKSGDACNDDVQRKVVWEGKVGILYPSDYGYASANELCKNDIYGNDSKCSDKNWLHPQSGEYWTMTAYSNSSYAVNAWGISSEKSASHYSVLSARNIYPTVYLKNSIHIVDGNGDSEPYKLMEF